MLLGVFSKTTIGVSKCFLNSCLRLFRLVEEVDSFWFETSRLAAAGLEVGWLEVEGQFKSVVVDDDVDEDVVANELVLGCADEMLFMWWLANVNFRKFFVVSWLLKLPEDSFIKFNIVLDWLFE